MTTLKNLKVSAVIVAAGKGERAGFDRNKLLEPIYGAPALWHTLKKFDMPEIDEVIVASSGYDFGEISALAAPFGFVTVVGGSTRTESVKRALEAVTGDITLIHDGARIFVSRDLIRKCIKNVEKYGSAVCALPSTDTLALTDGEEITGFSDRKTVMRLQTPQGFTTAEIRRAYSMTGGEVFTDDSSVFLKYISPPRLMTGEESNVKLTFAEDFLKERPPAMPDCAQRTGFGVDVHAFCAGDCVVLGGIKIPCDRGLLAHSDGDAVFHALTDALLSAAGLKDIGHYFPDNDPAFEGADSVKMCRAALDEVKKKGFLPLNASISVQAEKPRLAPHIDKMIEKVAHVLQIPQNCVAVSAGTCEGLGFVGEGLGIAAYAYVLLQEVKNG